MRTHVVLPEELIAEVDKRAGKRNRSRYIEEAVAAKLRLDRQREAFENARGSINLADYPHWSTPEKISEWVREQRQMDEERLRRVWRREV